MTISNVSRATVFDRGTGELLAPDWTSWLTARLLQAVHRLLASFRYYGISRAHGAIARLARPESITIIKKNSWKFSFPSRDYYWNRLLDSQWHYEPEIDFLLQALAKSPYVFIDLGANFGYWSSRVGAGVYGHRRAIAVEPSNQCFEILTRNVSGLEVSLHKRAIDTKSGEKIILYGDRHAGFSVNRYWHGASRQAVNEVESVSIDDLLRAEGVNAAETPVIVKLDVEGAELRALAGARQTVVGQSLFVVEESGIPEKSETLRFATENLGMTIFVIADGQIVEVASLKESACRNDFRHRFRSSILNIVATKSPFWLFRLRSLASAFPRQ
jgi:FkbM family methyltransferase